MTVEYLKTPSSIYGAQGGVVIDRAPVLYSPCTTAEVNHARLPETEDLRSMELAYREQYYTDRQLAHFAGLRLQMIFWGSLFLAVAAVLSGPFLPFEIGAGVAASLSFILTLSVVMRRTATTPLSIIGWFAGPLLAFVLLKLFVVLVVFRTFGTILLSLFTVLMYLFVGHRPFEFYRQWLYTHPRLKPETRAHPKTIRLRPSMFVLIGILLITIFVPLFSPTLAILGVIVFCLAAIGRDLRPLALLRSLKATIVELPAHLRRAKTLYDQVVKSGRPVRHGSVVGERDVFISTAHTGTGKTNPPLEHPGSGPVPARSVSQHPAVSTQTPREAVRRMRTLMQRVKTVFGQYLTYGLGSTDAPGVWLPPHGQAE